MKGKLIIISAPSGTGKTSIIKNLINYGLDLAFSVSATSRKPRTKERNGIDYHFLEHSDFMKKVQNNEFLEWEEVYDGTCYGTLKSEVERLTNQGKNVIFDVDVVGGINIKNIYGERALTIFIRPPSIAELKRRLTMRNTDTPETIEKRLAKAEHELTFENQFDITIVNDDLLSSSLEIKDIIANFLK